MKPLVSPPLPLIAVIAAAAALLAAAGCGPESFDRSRHKDAAADAGSDGAGGPDQGVDGADDMAPATDADLDALDGDGGDDDGGAGGEAGGADAGDAATGSDATDARDGSPDAGCRPTYSGDLLHIFDMGGSIFMGPAPDPAGPLPPSWFA